MPSFESTNHILVLPRLRVQNINTISSPLTWGFPSMTAFLGFMWALERKIPAELSKQITFTGIGVICHNFTPQATRAGYQYSFHQTRNPIDSKGETRSIAEEGRAHMEVTLLLGAEGGFESLDLVDQQKIAREIALIVEKMRLAGGSILPQKYPHQRRAQPEMIRLESDGDAAIKQFKKLRCRWLPGSCLVLREDLLRQKHTENFATDPTTSLVDSWLDFAKLGFRSEVSSSDSAGCKETAKVDWVPIRKPGWLVPIPVGYSAISTLYRPGEVAATRDDKTHFRFVESIYSVGEWISPHRLTSVRQLLWYTETDKNTGIYKCANNFAALITSNSQ